ncbi:MAG: antibiotic biosynthesis monooxygenase [Anaerolineae bacterium]|nr:antibiotic biosynthesis monooxygenase [Anaerolineae bacterium]
MRIVIVHIHVQPEAIAAFIAATTDNARHSLEEEGIVRFDFMQQRDDPTRFVLVEVYRDEDAPARHKETAHYQRWRAAVADMMAEPRQGQTYSNLFPDDAGWS